MKKNKYKDLAEKLLEPSGVKINGTNPWDIQVTDERFYRRVISGGSLALGESYMDGWWHSGQLDECVAKILQARLDKKAPINLSTLFIYASARLINQGSKKYSHKIGEKHYDTGNDLFEAMLDTHMQYSCAYWSNLKNGTEAANLEEAQKAKLDLICRKLKLKPGMRVLDIGCGWGGLAKYMAENYKVSVLGVTVSKEQAELARKRNEGLPVEIRIQDYRLIKGEVFDRIVSVGMFEHVGPVYYSTYMKAAEPLLKDDGIFLLHTIGRNFSGKTTDAWLNKYIFPGSVLPSIAQLSKATEHLFVMEDWYNFGQDYDKTLMAWNDTFDKAWPTLKHNYNERFYRMWKYYLLSCAGIFRARHAQLWQVVFTKGKNRDRYVPER